MDAEVESEDVSREKSIRTSLHINNELAFITVGLETGGKNVKRFKFRRRYSESNTTKPKSKSIQGRKHCGIITHAKPLMV